MNLAPRWVLGSQLVYEWETTIMIKSLRLLWISVLLIQPSTLLAQSELAQDWAAVPALTTGSKLRIETKTGARVEGKLVDFSDSTLTITRKGKTVSFDRVDVQRIYRLGGWSRLKSSLVGTGLGAGIGVGVAAATLGATGGSDETGAIVGMFTALGAGVGAAVGALVERGGRRTLVYESR